MLIPLFRSAGPTRRDLQAAQTFFPSVPPMYSNSNLKEKLQLLQWLISATLLKFNHLQRVRGWGHNPVFHPLTPAMDDRSKPAM